MKYALISEEQLRQVKEALECAVTDEMFELGKYETALAIIQSLKPNYPVAWNHLLGCSMIYAQLEVRK